MELKVKTCYSRILWLLCSGKKLEQAIYKIDFTSPNFQHEGLAGYIETTATIHIKDLASFTHLWESYHSLTDKRKSELYGLAKGLGDCK